MNLKEYIKNKSKDLNIDIVGFTNGEKFSHLDKFLLNRREKKYETEFEEKDIDLRLNPLNTLNEVKTIIVIGISYNVDYETKKRPYLSGRLSKSSLGEDYHNVLKHKMNMLVNEIKKVTDFKYFIGVDTGPLIDRELASKSGIGWYGKNCCIVNDIYGSFIFIGYILTDLDIECDERIKAKCDDCTLCLKACPTNAIGDNYEINARRCISYLTQTKDKIPYELRDKMGTKIYGCDTCQLVCPKNKGITKGKNKDFIPMSTNGYIEIKELFQLSNKEFKEKYGHMAGSWRGKNVLKRNAIIALGNIGDKDSIGLIEQGLKDDSSMIREYAAWALLKIDLDEGTKILKKHILKEKNETVIDEINNLIKYFSTLSSHKR
ncbi:epoxyqueuosine reductase QueG [Gottschalkia purinilytica]|uniref:Epoxyqueuosine reductase QueG n=1 Tax=Gottschalkia purinilytica TaxID=1503 RepID=A0A0L0WFD7_GOTPU|nr:tRNA epoxyqueuosine(34) reductase QueG [Gottschalkia purinilytica]KNF10146.1 epoxyqueuosine reductase QueG [Gottschalkia purinilytica]